MLKSAKDILGRVLRLAHGTAGRAAHELTAMDARDLSDLGVGRGEIAYLLQGGGRGHDGCVPGIAAGAACRSTTAGPCHGAAANS